MWNILNFLGNTNISVNLGFSFPHIFFLVFYDTSIALI